MTLFDKLKFLIQIKKMLGDISMLEKLKTGMAKMDGWKSTVGLLMVVAYYALPQWGIHVPDAVLKIGSGWAALGLAHKLDKATGLLTVVLQILTATKDSVNQGEVKK